MPEFEPGVSKTAIVPMTNPTTKAFDYMATLFMGTDLMVMAQEPFHLEAGESKSINLTVTMPSAPGSYPIHIGVSVAGENIALYKATEDVAIASAVVTIALKNPPSGANRWGLTLYDWSGEKSLGTTVYRISGKASFNIPSDWAFPLRFWISIIHYPDGSVTEFHQAQSLSTSWPNYVEEFIPGSGNYYYNVATGRFEKTSDEIPDVEVVTLRPCAAGDYTNIDAQIPDSGDHWDKVDDVTPDDGATYIRRRGSSLLKDAYKLSAFGASGTIVSVTVCFRFRSQCAMDGYQVWATPYLRLGTNETAGTRKGEVSNGGFKTHSEVLARPGGGNWTVADLAVLQVCIGLAITGTHDWYADNLCTQVYVEVDYTPS